jgi:hypothetical protein
MAITQNTYTGNGSTILFSFTFPYLNESDIKVEVNGTLTTAYTLATATTIQFTTAPANGASVRIYRETSDSQLQAEFFPGSAIRAQDLNSDFNQSLYIAQETRNNSVDPNNASFLDDVNFNNHKGINLATPTDSTDASTKGYVDGLISTGAANAAAAAASASAAAGSASSAAASYDSFDDRYLGSKPTDPALDNDGNSLITGAIYFNSTSNVMRVWNGATWQDSSANANVLRWRKTAVGGETSLTGADDNAATLTYTVNLEFVYLNGVLLTRGADYTASNGTSITGLVALEAGDVVEVLSYSSFSLVNVPATSVSFTQNGTGAVSKTLDAKLKKDSVSVWDFGVTGDGVADDTAALQAFFSHIAANNVGTAYCSGNFRVSSGITFGSGTTATKHIVGDLTITATTAVDTVLRIDGFSLGMWNGDLTLVGTGSVSYSTRTCRVGVLITGSSRATFDKIYAQRFYQYGVYVTSTPEYLPGATNTTLVNLGDVKVTDCGSGYPGGSNLTASWSNPVNSGTSNSTGQRTVIDVTTLPPDRPEPIVVFINGEAYYVYAVDRVNSKLTLFPWIDNTLSSGTLEYVTGAGLYVVGSDAGIVNLDMVDATRCSVGLWTDAVYGVIAKRVVTQFCLAAFAVGGDPSDASVTFSLNGLYCENNTCDILRITRADIGGIISAEYALNLSKVFYTCDARATASNARSNIFGNIRSILINRYGTLRSCTRDPNNQAETGSTLPIYLSTDSSANPAADKILVYKRNSSWTINIQTPSTGLHKCTGETATTLVLIGTGANGAPSGTFTFNPPAGYTVNGGASAAFSGFVGPAVFFVYWNVATNDFDVRCLTTQTNQASPTYDPPSIASGAQVTVTAACTGAVLGDYAIASFSQDLQGITLSAYVSAANTVTVVFRNGTAGPIDLGSGTLRVRTSKP